MNREEALQKSDDAIQELIEALKQGKSERLVQYLDTVSRFHKYSLGNVLLILTQKPEATFVAGFHKWKDFCRWVKKDEKGIAILAPLLVKKKKDNEAGQERVASGDEPTKRFVAGFRVVYVFDVSQTEGKELPELGKIGGEPGENIAKVERLIQESGIDLSYVDALGGALGVSEGGKISVLRSLSNAQRFAVLVHELAHELLHRGDRRQETTKTIRETEAEAVAYIVTKATGLEVSSVSVDYIQLWNGSDEVLIQSLELVRDTASKILSVLEAPLKQEAEYAA